MPALKAFLEADSRDLAAAIAKLDEDQKHWEPQRARLRGLPLARIGREREDIRSIRTELRDLAAVIEYRLADRLSAEQVGRLCRVYTHRSWPAQNRWIAEILKDAGPGAAPTIRDHIKRTARELPELQAVIELAMPKVSSTPTRWRYERAVALRGNIRRGIKGLEGVVEGMRK